MAFKPYAYGTGNSDGYEYFAVPVGFTPKLGQTLGMKDGELGTAAVADMPKYICMTEVKNGSPEELAAIRVKETTRFATTFAEDGSAVNVGDRLQITTDGMEVNATTGGVFEVVEIKSPEVGGEVIGRFVKGGNA